MLDGLVRSDSLRQLSDHLSSLWLFDVIWWSLVIWSVVVNTDLNWKCYMKQTLSFSFFDVIWASPSPLAYLHVEMPVSMHFCPQWLLQPVISFFFLPRNYQRIKLAYALSLCTVYVCAVCVSVCVLLDQEVKWDYRVTQLEHICFSEESHNMARIYSIIQSVLFRSVFPTLFTRHYSQYSSSLPSAVAIELEQAELHVY